MSPKRRGSNTDVPGPSKKRKNASRVDDAMAITPHISQRFAEEAESGIIEYVALENFMCHQKLCFTFGSNVNFITGRNGSGKSAILTGIVLGLGGRASATSRGQSVKNFIKSGKNFAFIEIVLRNGGNNPYRPEDYGNKIMIERRLSSDGTSTYKLKSANGKIISNKKEELMKVLDQFNIQVDNPVTILNQETSRNFLNSTDSRDKYKFFARATQLEDIENSYAIAKTNHSLANDRLIKKKTILPNLKKEMEAREKEWHNHQSLEKQRQDVADLRLQLLWSIVKGKEREVEALQEKKEKYENGVATLEAKVETEEENIVAAQKEKDEVTNDLKKLEDEMTELKPRFNDLKAQETNLKKDKSTKDLAVRKITLEMRNINKDKVDLSNKIQQLKAAGTQDYTEERRRREIEIERLSQLREELRAKLPTTQNDYEQVTGSVKHNEEELFNYQQEERNINRQIDNLKKTLANYEASRSNNLRKFGKYIPEVVNKVEAAYQRGQFIKKPVGPIGNHVEILNADFALAAECCVGGVMTAFCCDNMRDEKVLLDIFRTTIKDGPKPPIMVSKFEDYVYDVRAHSVRSNEYKSVLDTLSIKNPVVANCLIDQCEVESVLLVNDSPSARKLMLRNPPPNCKMTFAGNGDTIYPAPNFRFYSSTKSQVRFLTTTVEENINEINREIEDLNAQKPAIHEKINQIKERINTDSRHHKEYEAKLGKLRKEINGFNLKINELKNIEDPEPPNFALLEEDLEGLALKYRNLDEKRQEAAKALEEVDKKLVQVQTEIKEIRDKIDEFHIVSEPLKTKFTKQAEILGQHQQKKSTILKKLKEIKASLKTIDTDLIKAKAETNELVERTATMGERIETDKSTERLEREIAELQKHLDREEAKRGKKEDVLKRYRDAQIHYDSVRVQIDQYKRLIDRLMETLDHRHAAFARFRKTVELKIKYLFMTCLATRGYKGKIIFNHGKRTLDLLVQPTESVEHLNNDMKSLSGGERSYSTVCFILALWDAIDNPFRILDEYDVFMDMVNRKLSMDMMLATASENWDHQFIFLTPLDMPINKTLPNMKICRMPDPERGQESAS